MLGLDPSISIVPAALEMLTISDVSVAADGPVEPDHDVERATIRQNENCCMSFRGQLPGRIAPAGRRKGVFAADKRDLRG